MCKLASPLKEDLVQILMEPGEPKPHTVIFSRKRSFEDFEVIFGLRFEGRAVELGGVGDRVEYIVYPDLTRAEIDDIRNAGFRLRRGRPGKDFLI